MADPGNESRSDPSPASEDRSPSDLQASEDANAQVKPSGPLRRGWTTGACATAAAKAAVQAWCGGPSCSTVSITLPRGEQPVFDLVQLEQGADWARAAVIKDAGDDPDVTHGALIMVTVQAADPGAGVVFRAGPGVGTVTKPGLPLAPGEPAINPMPRQMMRDAVLPILAYYGKPLDVTLEVSIPGGEEIALKTWNPRLGILGGLSVLGTTGVVVPYSCSAWIHSIQRGIDVARASGLSVVAGCVGSTSERAVRSHLGVTEEAIIDMGDFVGGMLKYLRLHPVPQVIIAGGFAKLCKLADGHMDLHSKRSQVDVVRLAADLAAVGGEDRMVAEAKQANTALDVLKIAGPFGAALAARVCQRAYQVAVGTLDGAPVQVAVVAVDRTGGIIGQSPAELFS